MGSMSLVHWLVVLGIALLLFGNRLPTIGKSLGSGIRNFKSGLNGDDEDKDSQSAQGEKKQLQQGSQGNVSSGERQNSRQNEG
jgi:sec-independent protein translocase protein TatA